MHWDWDWHSGHAWHRPWDSYLYHYKCPLRKRFWSSLTDFDWDFHHDFHHFDCCHKVSEWCHRSCLTGRVYVESGEEEDTCGKGTYKVIIDVHHFRMDELKIKVKNSDILILEGQQKDDRASKTPALCITKSCIRKYKLPRNYDATLAKATLSKDGILTVMVPAPPDLDDVEREIEIQTTEAYFGAVDNKDDKAIEDKDGSQEEEEKEEK